MKLDNDKAITERPAPAGRHRYKWSIDYTTQLSARAHMSNTLRVLRVDIRVERICNHSVYKIPIDSWKIRKIFRIDLLRPEDKYFKFIIKPLLKCFLKN